MTQSLNDKIEQGKNNLDKLHAVVTGAADATVTIDGQTVKTLAHAIADVESGGVADGSITTGKLANNAVTSAKIANNTITAAQIANGTITAAQIANGVIPSSTGGLKSIQVFTASGTWTKPSGITLVKVIVTGGGGYGSGVFPGAGGGTAIKIIDVTSITSVVVTVGAGGSSSSNTGGTSSFGTHCSATGGGYGDPATGGAGTGGDINLVSATVSGSGRIGTSTIWGSGGGGTLPYGAGAGEISPGVNGGSGIVYIEEYK